MTSRIPASLRIAEFAAGFTPARMNAWLYRQAGRAVLDTIAVAVAGRNEDASLRMLDYVRGRGADRMATAWGAGLRLPPEEAALYNGVAGHVLDYDDVTLPMRGHPSVALLPALIALGEAYGKSGRDLATAFVVGFEVICKFSKTMVNDHYAKGWHSTSSVGVLGATVACCHLLGLTREQTANALGIAVAQAAGCRANFGTMSKSFHAGYCGAAAVRAALLAQRGFTGSHEALDGEYGYMALYANGEDLHGWLDTLGAEPLEIETSGIEIKNYPLCYATHRAIQGTIELREEHALTLDQVERAAITVSYRGMVQLIHPRPQTGLEAKFSMPHAVAAALLDGQVGLTSFEDAKVQRPALQEFFGKVEAGDVPGTTLPRWTRIRLHLKDGRTLEKTVHQLRGAPDCPVSDGELLQKTRNCLAFGRYQGSAQALADAAYAIERLQVAEILERGFAAAGREPAISSNHG